MAVELGFKNGAEALKEIAARRYEAGDLEGTVSAYRSALEKLPFDYDANACLAEILTSVESYVEAVNCWFKARSSAGSDFQKARAYNGLAANFYFMDNDMLSMHYFREQLEIDNYTDFKYNYVIDELSEAASEEIESRESDPPIFKLSGGGDDVTEVCDALKIVGEALNADDLEGADQTIRRLPVGSQAYLSALELTVFACYAKGEYDEVLTRSDKILLFSPDNADVLYHKCRALLKLKREKEAESIVEELSLRASDDTDVNAKIIFLAISVGKEELALRVANAELNREPHNVRMMTVRSIINYNLGNREEALREMRSVNLFVDSIISKERLRKMTEAAASGLERIEYDMDVDRNEVLKKHVDLSEKFGLLLDGIPLDVTEIIDQCDRAIRCGLDEIIPVYLQAISIVDVDRAETYFDDLLLDVSVPDLVKVKVIKEYLIQGKKAFIRYNSSQLYRESALNPCFFKGYAGELFSEAYAEVAANLYMIVPDKILSLKRKLAVLKDVFTENGGDDGMDPCLLAAGVTYLLKIRMLSTRKAVKSLYGVTDESLDAVLFFLERRQV